MPVMIIVLMLSFFGNADAGELWTKYELAASIKCITGDSNNIWVGTAENRIIRINRNDWSQTVYTSKTDSIGDKVQFIAVDSSGKVFAGTGNDGYNLTGWISIFEKNLWKPFHNNENGLLGTDIKGIKADKDNKIWIAVNHRYSVGTGDSIYIVGRQAIQYYENSQWQTKKMSL